MRLELGNFPVDESILDRETRLDGRSLRIDREQVIALARQEGSIASVDVDLARPGERTRIVHVLDVVEPRVKVRGRGVAFPGFLGPTDTVGDGRTHRLGINVVQTATYPAPATGLLRQREAIVDLSGPGAACAYGSDRLNLVLRFEAAEGGDNAEFDAAMRRATLRVSAHLAEATRQADPAEVESFEQTPVDPALPRIAYVYQLQSQGLFADTFLYGREARQIMPTLIHPNELFDGALVSGVFVFAAMKIPTAVHNNNPVVRELYRLHGQELNFVGVILTEGHNKTLPEKERAASWAAKLALLLKADGVVLTQESGGMSIVSQMLTAKACESLGIRTALVSYEMAGPEGTDPSFIFSTPEADAIVSTGNREQPITLPPMERALGGTYFLDDGRPATDGIDTRLNWLYSAQNQTGALRLRAYQY